MIILIVIASIIGGLIALVIILGLIAPREYDLEQEIVINKSNQEVYEFIKYLKNQDQFSKWNLADPGMKKTYTGTDGIVGFKYEWDSKDPKVGTGEQTIIGIDEGKRVDFALHFIKPYDGRATAYIKTTAASGSQTNVKWGLHSGMTFPMNAMLIVFDLRKALSNDLKIGLDKSEDFVREIVIGYWLLVIGYWLLVIGYWLLVIRFIPQ